VRLTETDHDGLSATVTQRVIVSGPPTAAFSAATNGLQDTFVDQPAAGIERAPISGRA
jgi:hypothetical protein